MDKSNLELFKQAISEGLSQKFDSVVNSYTDEIVCSEKHNIAMRTIVYGKADTKRVWSPKMKRIIAILVAAALLLTSCAIIFRDEIREVFEEFFVKITYSNGEDGKVIEEVYELGYLPKGYSLSNEKVTPVRMQYEFVNENKDYIWFEQKLIDGTDFVVDSENGYAQVTDIHDYDVYYKLTQGDYDIALDSFAANNMVNGFLEYWSTHHNPSGVRFYAPFLEKVYKNNLIEFRGEYFTYRAMCSALSGKKVFIVNGEYVNLQ